ncbi:epoxide hydrolase [Rhizopus stolonifer]|uniref:Epoxide hydrolase n=1 Tax=Rhizopus stolonifer TaxID=4846 RepID=A0A367KYL6_RHIST|nr:epoxide hydrolase [Rhizopus stolonifer]
MVEPFTIPSLDTQELSQKLSHVRFPQELDQDQESIGWKLGAPSWAVKEMLEKWKQFDWETSKQEMSRWHHYHTRIHDLKIHFVHEPTTAENATPIVLLHGWPSTFYEFHKPLRDGSVNSQAFHVVVPSLPGYGFSEAPQKEGCGVMEMARTMHELMLTLGYDKYMIFGTDWGAIIGYSMAQQFPQHCMGFLTSMPTVGPPLPTLTNLINHPFKVFTFIFAILVGMTRVYGEYFKSLESTSFANVDKDMEAGYRAIQSTRPYTLAYGLTDSPVGLLGWMLEKYHNWTHFDSKEAYETQALPHTVSSNEFLTQVSIYWITNSMSSSIRLYYEAKKNMSNIMGSKVHVPFGTTYFAGELMKIPRDWIEANTNLVQHKTHNEGGHFASLEVPHLVSQDIAEFAKRIRSSGSERKNA